MPAAKGTTTCHNQHTGNVRRLRQPVQKLGHVFRGTGWVFMTSVLRDGAVTSPTLQGKLAHGLMPRFCETHSMWMKSFRLSSTPTSLQ